ncbi:high-affinity nickel-transport family protein [Perilla frutescens var. hirtella]|uniref:High-affinity nickel-transport family protein n=1 Tax=Perilla frutescens var. hirtella TaxID=608512 RepID=A0AAD4IYF1_PERFH|nr:high-affinity nickel-transport family protein [Perilla frutescens var. hirtella]KAH6811969.1 high-affinity nickel-transport family protein [Perilla frutescens var. frutescens]KAH6823323.1 high-affinity nickel-transport family protein [Perilla frutescens var. hirtella]
MERLIYSNSIPSQRRLNSPFLPQLAQPGSPQRLGPSSFSPPASFPPVPRRFNPASCSLNVNNSGFLFRKGVDDSPEINLESEVDLRNGSKPEPAFLEWVAQKLSQRQKVVNAGKVILLSAFILTFLHPTTVSPAFASFESAVNTGGPAAVAVGNSLVRSELLSSAWTGFFAGCLHTLSGPDHLAALAPLSIGRSRMESAAVGALWGCGHDAGQLLFGLLFLILKDRLHIEIIRTWGTRVVGLTLLVIGAMGIREASEVPVPCVALENGECDVSEYESLASQPVGKKKIGFATFATGIVHGLQPDALMMILPALALPSRLAGAAFLLMFLVGTVIAMGSYTVFIGSCSEALKERVPRITEKLTWASSLIAIALGLSLLVSQFFGFSLY